MHRCVLCLRTVDATAIDLVSFLSMRTCGKHHFWDMQTTPEWKWNSCSKGRRLLTYHALRSELLCLRTRLQNSSLEIKPSLFSSATQIMAFKPFRVTCMPPAFRAIYSSSSSINPLPSSSIRSKTSIRESSESAVAPLTLRLDKAALHCQVPEAACQKVT